MLNNIPYSKFIIFSLKGTLGSFFAYTSKIATLLLHRPVCSIKFDVKVFKDKFLEACNKFMPGLDLDPRACRST